MNLTDYINTLQPFIQHDLKDSMEGECWREQGRLFLSNGLKSAVQSNGLKSPKICLKHTKTAKFCRLSKFHTTKSNNYQKRMILDYQLKMTTPADAKNRQQ